MRKIFSFIFISAFIILGNIAEVKATHFAGADLSYTCLGGTTYKITLSFYRDCSGMQEPSSIPISFKCSSNQSFNFNSTLQKIPGTGVEVTSSCIYQPTSCAGGSGYGIQEFIYQATVTLPPCNSWTMYWSDCCRNTISSITGTPSWFIPAILNNLQAPCNISPTFSNNPNAVVCVGQTYCFNNGAIDADGDSLSYSFYSPFTTSMNATVPFNGSYTPSNFIPSSTPITLDPVTGDICFTPTQVMNTITGMKVTEWRKINGVQTIVGTVFRDIQLNAATCSNQIPTLSGMDTLLTATYNPNDTVYYLERCLSSHPIKFHINGHDSDTYNPNTTGSPEKFSINWNNGIPGGTFTAHNNQTDSAYAEFSWLPTAADVSNTPKCFTATVTDEACPYNGSQTFSYCIVIRGMMVEIGSDTLLCKGENIVIKATADTSTVNYIWTMNGNPTSTPLSQDSIVINSSNLNTGTNVLTIETNDGTTTMACPGIDAINIEVVYQPNINGTLLDSAFCSPGTITYDAGQGTMYSWTDFSGAPVGSAQTFTTSASGIYYVYVDGGSYTRCNDKDTFTVVSLENPKPITNTCIWAADAPYVLDAGVTSSGVYLWNTGDTTQTINVDKSGTYKVEIYHPTISPSVVCPASGVINIIDQTKIIESMPYQSTIEEPMPNATWQPGDSKVCTFQRVRFRGPTAPAGHSYVYSWFKDNLIVSNNDFFFFSEENTGNYEIKLNVGGCEDKVTVTAENCEITIPNIFTPNNDGVNDKFSIMMKDGNTEFYSTFPNTTLIVYNRWGKKVFESTNYQNDWDGENLAEGVYFWNLYLADGRETEMNGSVTILR